ncbi:hypothetical protein [Rhodococcoides yunnanense]|jgi:hypothetical protein|uniref:hypothetical protein n=1 Tax=Rhodococcoides yunnanense TaxID=278209 RepID=UPI0022B18BEB|nr:hypothetical protein [Rhodococcus yunnanensis]MCZ4276251.1 hypothetical protein [Rhodococcus yunnanensis]
MTDETKQAARRVREVWAASDAAWDQLEAAATAALATPPRGFEGLTPSVWTAFEHGLYRTWTAKFGAHTVSVEDSIDTNGVVSRSTGPLSIQSVEIETTEGFEAYLATVLAAASKFAEVRGR